MKYARTLQRIGMVLILLGLAVSFYLSYAFGGFLTMTSPTEVNIKETLQGIPAVLISCTGMIIYAMGLLSLAIKDTGK